MRIEEGWNVKRHHIVSLESNNFLEFKSEDEGGYWYYKINGYTVKVAEISTNGLLDIYFERLESLDSIRKIIKEIENIE